MVGAESSGSNSPSRRVSPYWVWDRNDALDSSGPAARVVSNRRNSREPLDFRPTDEQSILSFEESRRISDSHQSRERPVRQRYVRAPTSTTHSNITPTSLGPLNIPRSLRTRSLNSRNSFHIESSSPNVTFTPDSVHSLPPWRMYSEPNQPSSLEASLEWSTSSSSPPPLELIDDSSQDEDEIAMEIDRPARGAEYFTSLFDEDINVTSNLFSLPFARTEFVELSEGENLVPPPALRDLHARAGSPPRPEAESDTFKGPVSPLPVLSEHSSRSLVNSAYTAYPSPLRSLTCPVQLQPSLLLNPNHSLPRTEITAPCSFLRSGVVFFGQQSIEDHGKRHSEATLRNQPRVWSPSPPPPLGPFDRPSHVNGSTLSTAMIEPRNTPDRTIPPEKLKRDEWQVKVSLHQVDLEHGTVQGIMRKLS